MRKPTEVKIAEQQRDVKALFQKLRGSYIKMLKKDPTWDQITVVEGENALNLIMNGNKPVLRIRLKSGIDNKSSVRQFKKSLAVTCERVFKKTVFDNYKIEYIEYSESTKTPQPAPADRRRKEGDCGQDGEGRGAQAQQMQLSKHRVGEVLAGLKRQHPERYAHPIAEAYQQLESQPDDPDSAAVGTILVNLIMNLLAQTKDSINLDSHCNILYSEVFNMFIETHINRPLEVLATNNKEYDNLNQLWAKIVRHLCPAAIYDVSDLTLTINLTHLYSLPKETLSLHILDETISLLGSLAGALKELHAQAVIVSKTCQSVIDYAINPLIELGKLLSEEEINDIFKGGRGVSLQADLLPHLELFAHYSKKFRQGYEPKPTIDERQITSWLSKLNDSKKEMERYLLQSRIQRKKELLAEKQDGIGLDPSLTVTDPPDSQKTAAFFTTSPEERASLYTQEAKKKAADALAQKKRRSESHGKRSNVAPSQVVVDQVVPVDEDENVEFLRGCEIIDNQTGETKPINKETLFSIQGTHENHRLYISTESVIASEQEAVNVFKLTIERGKKLKRNQKGCSGIKFIPDLAWCSVRFAGNGDRLICIKLAINNPLSKEDVHLFVPYKVVKHTVYDGLYDRKKSDEMVDLFSTRHQLALGGNDLKPECPMSPCSSSR